MRKFDHWPSARAALLLFAGAGVVFVVLWVSILIAGPETVPGHFSFDGTVTRSDPTLEFLGYMALVGVGTAALVVGVARIPIEYLNIPKRDKWNTPELLGQLKTLVTADIWLLGAATLMLLVTALATSGFGGLGGEIGAWTLPVVVGPYLIVNVIVVGRMLFGSRYTPPGSAASRH